MDFAGAPHVAALPFPEMLGDFSTYQMSESWEKFCAKTVYLTDFPDPSTLFDESPAPETTDPVAFVRELSVSVRSEVTRSTGILAMYIEVLRKLDINASISMSDDIWDTLCLFLTDNPFENGDYVVMGLVQRFVYGLLDKTQKGHKLMLRRISEYVQSDKPGRFLNFFGIFVLLCRRGMVTDLLEGEIYDSMLKLAETIPMVFDFLRRFLALLTSSTETVVQKAIESDKVFDRLLEMGNVSDEMWCSVIRLITDLCIENIRLSHYLNIYGKSFFVLMQQHGRNHVIDVDILKEFVLCTREDDELNSLIRNHRGLTVLLRLARENEMNVVEWVLTLVQNHYGEANRCDMSRYAVTSVVLRRMKEIQHETTLRERYEQLFKIISQRIFGNKEFHKAIHLMADTEYQDPMPLLKIIHDVSAGHNDLPNAFFRFDSDDAGISSLVLTCIGSLGIVTSFRPLPMNQDRFHVLFSVAQPESTLLVGMESDKIRFVVVKRDGSRNTVYEVAPIRLWNKLVVTLEWGGLNRHAEVKCQINDESPASFSMPTKIQTSRQVSITIGSSDKNLPCIHADVAAIYCLNSSNMEKLMHVRNRGLVPPEMSSMIFAKFMPSRVQRDHIYLTDTQSLQFVGEAIPVIPSLRDVLNSSGSVKQLVFLLSRFTDGMIQGTTNKDSQLDRSYCVSFISELLQVLRGIFTRNPSLLASTQFYTLISEMLGVISDQYLKSGVIFCQLPDFGKMTTAATLRRDACENMLLNFNMFKRWSDDTVEVYLSLIHDCEDINFPINRNVIPLLKLLETREGIREGCHQWIRHSIKKYQCDEDADELMMFLSSLSPSEINTQKMVLDYLLIYAKLSRQFFEGKNLEEFFLRFVNVSESAVGCVLYLIPLSKDVSLVCEKLLSRLNFDIITQKSLKWMRKSKVNSYAEALPLLACICRKLGENPVTAMNGLLEDRRYASGILKVEMWVHWLWMWIYKSNVYLEQCISDLLTIVSTIAEQTKAPVVTDIAQYFEIFSAWTGIDCLETLFSQELFIKLAKSKDVNILQSTSDFDLIVNDKETLELSITDQVRSHFFGMIARVHVTKVPRDVPLFDTSKHRKTCSVEEATSQFELYSRTVIDYFTRLNRNECDTKIQTQYRGKWYSRSVASEKVFRMFIIEMQSGIGPWHKVQVSKRFKACNLISKRGARTLMMLNTAPSRHKSASKSFRMAMYRSHGQAPKRPRVEYNAMKQNTLWNPNASKFLTTAWKYSLKSKHKGAIHVSFDGMVFVSEEKMVKFGFDSVVFILNRRFANEEVGFEVFLSTCKSYLFELLPGQREKLYKFFALLKPNPPEFPHKQKFNFFAELRRVTGTFYQKKSSSELVHEIDLTGKWLSRDITTYEYLYYLNMLSGRSFNDCGQYPVFPWLLGSPNPPTTDLERPEFYRDLSIPPHISSSNPQAPFADMDCVSWFNPYSSDARAWEWLVRVEPFAQSHIQYNSGKFDNRIFYSVLRFSTEMFNGTSESEGVGELFTLPQLYINENKFDLDVSFSGKSMSTVELPAWAIDHFHFTSVLRRALESEFVGKAIAPWIDFVFGVDRGTFRGHRLFDDWAFPESGPVNKRLTICCGCLPGKLFTERHPIRTPMDIPAVVHEKQEKLRQSFQELGQIPTMNVLDVRKGIVFGENSLYFLESGDSIESPLLATSGNLCGVSRILQCAAFITPGSNLVTILKFGYEKVASFVLEHSDSCVTCGCVAGGEILVTGGSDGSIRRFDLNTNRSILVSAHQPSSIIAVAASSNLGLLVSISTTSWMVLETLIDGKLINAVPCVCNPRNTEIVIFKSGTIVVGQTASVTFYDSRGVMIQNVTFPNRVQMVHLAKYSDYDGRELLIVIIANVTITVYDVATRAPIRTYAAERLSRVSSVKLSRSFVAVGDDTASLSLFTFPLSNFPTDPHVSNVRLASDGSVQSRESRGAPVSRTGSHE